MWSVIKLGFSAIVEAIVTAVAFAMVVIVILWGVNGFPSASVADFIELVGVVGGIGTGISIIAKLIEFGWAFRALDKHGRAFDSAYDRLYSALAERDLDSARYWLDKLVARRQPLYDVLSHCAKWRGVNTTAITNMQWQVLDRVRIAREDIARTR